MKWWNWNVFRIFLLVMFASIYVCACAKEESGPRTVRLNEKTFTVDEEVMTISDGEYTYHYKADINGSSVSYKFTYPNGSYYYWTKSKTIGSGGWSDDYDEEVYVDGQTLIDVLNTGKPREKEPKNVLVIILLLLIGIFNAVSPETAWYLSDGWKYKNAEPSEEALGVTRLGGIVALVLGVMMILV